MLAAIALGVSFSIPVLLVGSMSPWCRARSACSAEIQASSPMSSMTASRCGVSLIVVMPPFYKVDFVRLPAAVRLTWAYARGHSGNVLVSGFFISEVASISSPEMDCRFEGQIPVTCVFAEAHSAAPGCRPWPATDDRLSAYTLGTPGVPSPDARTSSSPSRDGHAGNASEAVSCSVGGSVGSRPACRSAGAEG